jgi:hypothetical protein
MANIQRERTMPRGFRMSVKAVRQTSKMYQLLNETPCTAPSTRSSVENLGTLRALSGAGVGDLRSYNGGCGDSSRFTSGGVVDPSFIGVFAQELRLLDPEAVSSLVLGV